MRYLITGGLGFIGSHLADSLEKQGHELIILDDLSTGKREYAPENAAVIIESITTSGVFDAILPKVDGCFHLAAVSSVELSHLKWNYTHQVNVGGTVNLLAAIKALPKPIPVVMASSAAVYGIGGNELMSESATPAPISAYGVDKLAGEGHGSVAWNIHKIPNISLRFLNVYGPRQDPLSPYSGVISIFAKKLLANEPVTIHGDGLQSRDFIYVADIVSGLERAMDALTKQQLQHGIFNLCTGKSTTVSGLAETITKLLGVKADIRHGPARAGDARLLIGNPATAEKTLGFKANISLDAGLKKTLEWIKAYAA